MREIPTEGLERRDWKRFIYEETGIPCAHKHIFDMVVIGNIWGITRKHIDLLTEPDRTMCLRIRQDMWPYNQEMLDTMPPRLQTIIRGMATLWQKAVIARKSGTTVPTPAQQWAQTQTLLHQMLQGEPGREEEED